MPMKEAFFEVCLKKTLSLKGETCTGSKVSKE